MTASTPWMDGPAAISARFDKENLFDILPQYVCEFPLQGGIAAFRPEGKHETGYVRLSRATETSTSISEVLPLVS